MATTKTVPQAPSVRAPDGRANNTGLQRRVRNRVIAQAQVNPLQVMIDALAERWRLALAIEDDPEARSKAISEAVAVAEKVAPYLHPKLQATTIKGDPDAPLQFVMSLPGTSDLMAAVRGGLAKPVAEVVDVEPMQLNDKDK